MTTQESQPPGAGFQKQKRGGNGWKSALYAGKRAKLRKIAFRPATRVESGKLASQTQKKNGESGEPKGRDAQKGDNGAIFNDWKIMFRPGAGLHNLGNTCFMNSVLQCLTYTPPLAQSCLEQQYTVAAGGEAKFDAMQVFQQHVNTVLRSPGTVVPPHKFSRSLRLLSNRFRLGRQEDAHEYFRSLVESMEKSFTSKVSKKPTQEQIESCFIYRLFGGKLRSQIHCTACNYKSNKFDPILDLNLEIFRTRSLEKALHMFTGREVLDGNNKYSCPRCKNMVKAHKQMLISEAPNVLAIQLKRFAFGKYGMKIENRISFPAQLDLSPYVSASAKNKNGADSSVKYALYGVLVHSGHSLHSGHYYCYVKCPSGAWVCCDDQYVQMVSEKKVLEQKAYMLFYTREVNAQTTSGGGKMAEKVDSAAGKSKSGNGVLHNMNGAAVQQQQVEKVTTRGVKAKAKAKAKASTRQQVGSPSRSSSPSSPPGSPNRITKMGTNSGGSSASPLVSMSPSLQNSGWKRMLLCLPSRLRLHAASAMKQVVKEIVTKRIAAKNSQNGSSSTHLKKRRRSLEGDFCTNTRRSKRLLLKKGKKTEQEETQQADTAAAAASASTQFSAAVYNNHTTMDESSSSDDDNNNKNDRGSPQAKAGGKRARFGSEVHDWLRGDKGAGPYGVPVKKWNREGADAKAGSESSQIQAKADRLFRRLKPKQKHRDWYDDEYDMGKVKKVKQKDTQDGRKRLSGQSSAFQRAARSKFNAKSNSGRRNTSTSRY